MSYLVYILECADKTLYVGSTNDLAHRLHAHNSGKNGARYTSGRRPVIVKYTEKKRTKGLALRREAQLKRLTRAQKLELIKSV